MLKAVQQKEIAISLSDTTFFKNQNIKVNANLQSLVSRFELTKLTSEESILFNDLKENIQALLNSERQFLNSNVTDNKQVIRNIESLKINLDDLSKIQLNEGSKQMAISKRALDTVELFTHIEIYSLVFLAILIQVIAIYNPKEKS